MSVDARKHHLAIYGRGMERFLVTVGSCYVDDSGSVGSDTDNKELKRGI